MDIVCFGQQGWHVCWTAKQHLMTRLARRGHRVLYVDPEWREVRGTGGVLRAVAPVLAGDGILHVGPAELYVYTFGYPRPLPWRWSNWRRPRVVANVARQLGFGRDSVAVALRPDVLAEVDAVDPAAVLYYAVDEMSAFGTPSDAERAAARATERAMLARAHVAVGVSPRLASRFAREHAHARFLPNAVDAAFFAPERLAAAPEHPAIAALPHPRLTFVGQVDERVDQALLVTVARAHPDWQLVLAGRVKETVDVSRLAAEPNVHLLGYLEYTDLPTVLRGSDVCLVPYVRSELTQSCNPLKVYEYLATGLPVVATRLEPLAWCADVIALADDAAGFVAAVERALADPAAGRAARRARAAANTWDARAVELERLLEEARTAARGDRTPGAPPRWPAASRAAAAAAIAALAGPPVAEPLAPPPVDAGRASAPSTEAA